MSRVKQMSTCQGEVYLRAAEFETENPRLREVKSGLWWHRHFLVLRSWEEEDVLTPDTLLNL